MSLRGVDRHKLAVGIDSILLSRRALRKRLTRTKLLTGKRLLTREGLLSRELLTGELLAGIRYRGGGAVSHSLVMRARSGTIRTITSEHQLWKLRAYSAVNFDSPG